MLGRLAPLPSLAAVSGRRAPKSMIAPIGTTISVRTRFKKAHLPPQFLQRKKPLLKRPGYVPTLMQYLANVEGKFGRTTPLIKYKKKIHAMNPFVRLDDKTKIELEAYAEKLVAKAQSDKQQAQQEGTSMQAELELLNKAIDASASKKMVQLSEERKKKKAMIAARRAKKAPKKEEAEQKEESEESDEPIEVTA